MFFISVFPVISNINFDQMSHLPIFIDSLKECGAGEADKLTPTIVLFFDACKVDIDESNLR